jgi:sugar O-acyltransferase (sialic acid O-acetyltransferase NeuD family)
MAHKNSTFVVWGSGGTAKKLFDVVSMNRGKVIAIFDRNPATKSVIEGVPIHYGEPGLKTWLAARGGEGPCSALVGAASAHGSERIELLELFSRYGFATPSVFHPMAFVSPSAKVARGCAVFTLAIIDAHATLGEACVINDAARVGHDCVVGRAVHVAPGAKLLGGSRVGDHGLIGANAVVMPGVVVGANVKVGAGAIVLSDLAPNVVAVGNPARVLRTDEPRPPLSPA